MRQVWYSIYYLEVNNNAWNTTLVVLVESPYMIRLCKVNRSKGSSETHWTLDYEHIVINIALLPVSLLSFATSKIICVHLYPKRTAAVIVKATPQI